MSQQDNFSGGFMLGAIVGGLVGGVLGVALAGARTSQAVDDSDKSQDVPRPRRRPLRVPVESAAEPLTEQSMEVARQGLESKIAQLNAAIDDVRFQLDSVNRGGRNGQAVVDQENNGQADVKVEPR